MTSNNFKPITTALISVSDKQNIIEFASKLHHNGVKILSTGGTAKLLEENNIHVTEVADHTKFPEIMAGRVKTLHPKIHGGILGRRGTDDQVMIEHGIMPIDLVVVNLYPFEATIAKDDCTLESAIENIDIGGPAMVRSAAKNYNDVAVVTDPSDYQPLLDSMHNNDGLSKNFRFNLAVKAFEHTSNYDGNIANYLGKINFEDGSKDTFPQTINLQYQRIQTMRYGENPHQNAALFKEAKTIEASVATAKQIQGKELSFNNISDTDTALECVKQFQDTACVIVKHANPCGVATQTNILKAYNKAFETDPESAFGGIIAFNRELDSQTAKVIVEQQFVEVIIAPTISDDAVKVVGAKKNVRLLACGQWEHTTLRLDMKRVNGGLLVQDADLDLYNDLTVVTKRHPTEKEMQDLLFAWKVSKFVKSNAIVYCKNQMTIGIGAGQMSRINSARIAGIKAKHAKLEVMGSVMASDAFFPFRDGIDAAKDAGIVAVIQPGGSIRDQEVIDAANEAGMAMIFTGMRHFRH